VSDSQNYAMADEHEEKERHIDSQNNVADKRSAESESIHRTICLINAYEYKERRSKVHRIMRSKDAHEAYEECRVL
jgi:hypothetical protein